MRDRSLPTMQRVRAQLLLLSAVPAVSLGVLVTVLCGPGERLGGRPVATSIEPTSHEIPITPPLSEIETDWFTAASATMEYHASASGQGLKAPNRAHSLRTYFRGADVEVVFIPRRRAEGN